MSNTITPAVFYRTRNVEGWKSYREAGPRQLFYEPPEDAHTVSRNARKTKPAKFVVFFIKNEGAPGLTPVH